MLKVATAAATLALLATITAVTGTPSQLAMHRSCGYHCNEDGSDATPAAPPTIEVQPAGRTNIHADGRAAGKAMPRQGSPIGRGIGGHAIHKVDFTVEVVGRTNIHSGGRLHGSANKRVGCGGCAGHPASNDIIIGIGNAAGLQLF